MIFTCKCGSVLSDVASPAEIEHLLISDKSIEKLQDNVDEEVEQVGTISMWPEHWESSQATPVWKCYSCKRLYINPTGPADETIVYSIDSIGRSGD